MKAIRFILTGMVVIIITVVLIGLCVDSVQAAELEEPGIKHFYTDAEAEMIAQAVWGEARGCSDKQKAAVVWCILNRVDSPRFGNSIESVVTAPGQFFGYSAGNPVDEDILELVKRMLIQWAVEEMMPADDRVLPPEYLYFSGNGVENIYTTEYQDGIIWDWSLEYPNE